MQYEGSPQRRGTRQYYAKTRIQHKTYRQTWPYTWDFPSLCSMKSREAVTTRHCVCCLMPTDVTPPRLTTRISCPSSASCFVYAPYTAVSSLCLSGPRSESVSYSDRNGKPQTGPSPRLRHSEQNLARRSVAADTSSRLPSSYSEL